MVSLLILISNLFGGGSERVASELVNNIPNKYDCQLIIREDTESRYYIGNNVRKPISLHLSRPTFVPYFIWIIYKLLIDIIRYTQNIKRYHADASMSFLLVDNFINIISCKLAGTKAIISIRGNPSHDFQSLLNRIIMRVTIFLSRLYAKKIITNSTGIKKLLIRDFGVKDSIIEVINNPKDIAHIQTLQKVEVTEIFFNTNKPIIITVGRLTKIKGHDHLIRIFAYLHQEMPCRLVLCGVGELQTQLEQMAVDLHVCEDVLFIGWCENPYKYMNHSTIFVLPSLTEAQPNSLIEAMICGCPVVAADCNYGPREILDGGKYGLLSESFFENIYDTQQPLTPAEIDMANKIHLVISDSDVREFWAKQGLVRASIFDKEAIIKQYLDVIQQVADI